MATARIADDPLRGSRRLLRRLGGRRGPDHLPGEAPCRVLVGGAADVAGLRDAVGAALGVAGGPSPLRIGGLRVEVGRNAHAGAADAGRWPLAVELAPVEPVPRAAYVDAVGALLRGLWAHDLRAVAFCAFVDELPRAPSAGRLPAPRV